MKTNKISTAGLVIWNTQKYKFLTMFVSLGLGFFVPELFRKTHHLFHLILCFITLYLIMVFLLIIMMTIYLLNRDKK